MRPTLLLTCLFIGLAGAGLFFLTSVGGAAKETNVQDLIKEEFEGYAKLKLQVLDFSSTYKPVQFRAIEIVPEGQLPSSDAPAIEVRYEGDDIIPLEEYNHVAVEGKWDKATQVFHASKMVTQCPSHYEGQGTPPKPTKPMVSSK